MVLGLCRLCHLFHMHRESRAICINNVSHDCRDTILSTFLAAANAFGYSGSLVWQVRQCLKPTGSICVPRCLRLLISRCPGCRAMYAFSTQPAQAGPGAARFSLGRPTTSQAPASTSPTSRLAAQPCWPPTRPRTRATACSQSWRATAGCCRAAPALGRSGCRAGACVLEEDRAA